MGKKTLNTKAPGRDGVRGFWITILTNRHEQTALQLNKILDENHQLSEWLTYVQTVLCQKDKGVDKEVLGDCTRRSTNLAMTEIDYRKAYDMIPHSWISKCLYVFGVAENTKISLKKA